MPPVFAFSVAFKIPMFGFSLTRVSRSIFGFLAFALAVSAPASAASIEWNPDVLAAQRQARRENKPLLVKFWSPQCPRCTFADQNVWTQPRVQNAAQSFVMVRADVTTELGNGAMGQLGMRSVSMPDVQIFNRQGQRVFHQDKRLDPIRLVQAMVEAGGAVSAGAGAAGSVGALGGAANSRLAGGAGAANAAGAVAQNAPTPQSAPVTESGAAVNVRPTYFGRWNMKKMLGVQNLPAARQYEGTFLLTERGVELLDARPRVFLPVKRRR